MGRKKLFDKKIVLPLSSAMIDELDAVVTADESRLDVIRDAINRELHRRKDHAADPGNI